MKIVLLFSGGRAGSDLLQSLFDGHPQILQFPGVLHFTKDFLKIFQLKNPDEISKEFIRLNPFFFDSRINKIERHHQLGDYKNDFFTFDTNLFKSNFKKLFNKNKNKNILEYLHQAYILPKKNKNKYKIILIHVHLYENFLNFRKIYKMQDSTKILITYRDPVVSMCSTIKHWLRYRRGVEMTPRGLFSNFQMHFNIFNNLKDYKKNTRVVRLEKIHLDSKKIINNICNFLGIKYSPVLLKSTYFGKKWWGDAVSRKFHDGLNSNFKNNFDKKIFLINELKFIEDMILNILKKYRYPIRSNLKFKINKFYFFLFNFEKKFYKITIQKQKFKTKLSIIYFYFKRLVLFRKRFSKENLPNEV